MFKKARELKPCRHPKLENGYTRIELPEIEASTDKATLFKFENNVKVWIPCSQYKIRYSNAHPKSDPSVLEVKNWFYDRNLVSAVQQQNK